MTAQRPDGAGLEHPLDPPSSTVRGRLKVYLGAAPGSGKTFAMLREGRDRRESGEDVVVGFVETHGRARTAEAIGTLEVVPRITIEYRGARMSDMDAEAVISRRPHVALVDELAHTNAPGMRNAKRWRDVEDIRAAGIDVITTMNIQHLESVRDLVEQITGIAVRETVPDTVLDSADEVQFIDITPEALRKRMRHGNVYALDRVDTALENFFREGNLAALREIGLRLVADRVDGDRGGVQDAPEDVVVAVSNHPSAARLIRRGVRLARRTRGLCAVVHVSSPDDAPGRVAAWKTLAAELECPVIEHDHGSIASAVTTTVLDRSARHLVVGEPRMAGGLGGLRRTIVDRLIDALPDVDVHVIARDATPAASDDGKRDPERLLRGLKASPSRMGGLRVYLGYAPGVGTTTAMLEEARRRRARGTDVVVAGLRDDHAAALGGLPRVGRSAGGLLDIDALLARNPEVAAVDDLAAIAAAGTSVAEAVPRLRAAGITVIATVRMSDLRSTVLAMGDLLGRDPTRAVVEDETLDAADELELVDVVPSELEQRLRDGLLMSPRDAAHALQGMFRPPVLATLRELAFRRVAQHTDRRLVDYMTAKRIDRPWEARSRALVCVAPEPGQERLLTAAARSAAARGGALTALSVRHGSHSDAQRRLLGAYAALTHQLGGTFTSVDGADVVATIASFARAERITEIVLRRAPGRRRRSRLLHRLIRLVTEVDVHILAAG